MKLKSLLLFSIIIFSLSAFVYNFPLQYNTASATDDDNSGITDTLVHQKILHMPRAPHYFFAGERVPVENEDVWERLDKELTIICYQHSATSNILKRTTRYFPVIERIFREEDVPVDFKYLAVAESRLENLTSPAGAKGYWQFMKPTATYFGLRINSEIDERYNIEKSTRAAAKYLKSYYEQFGSWTLAAAAYNMGGPRLKRNLKDQKEKSYYDLNLNSETQRYVFRIIAYMELLRNPQKYGYQLNEQSYYKPFEYSYLSVEDPVKSLADLAHDRGITYRELKRYNPWLLDNTLAKQNTYDFLIKIPVD